MFKYTYIVAYDHKQILLQVERPENEPTIHKKNLSPLIVKRFIKTSLYPYSLTVASPCILNYLPQDVRGITISTVFRQRLHYSYNTIFILFYSTLAQW